MMKHFSKSVNSHINVKMVCHRLVNLFFLGKEEVSSPGVDHLKSAKASSMKSHELTNEAKTRLTHILF